MSIFAVFSPTTTVTLAASGASSRVQLQDRPGVGESTVRVVNALAEAIHIKFGDSAVTATTSDMPMLTNTIEIFNVNPGVTHVAVITGGGTGNVYFTTGNGA